MRTIALLLALVCYAAPTRAVSPVVGDIRPTGGQRGTEMEILFQGDRLVDAQEILFFSPGIQVLKLEPTNTVVKGDRVDDVVHALAPRSRHMLLIR